MGRRKAACVWLFGEFLTRVDRSVETPAPVCPCGSKRRAPERLRRRGPEARAPERLRPRELSKTRRGRGRRAARSGTRLRARAGRAGREGGGGSADAPQPGAWAACRDPGPLRRAGVVARGWEGFAPPAASSVRESAELPGGRPCQCPISGVVGPGTWGASRGAAQQPGRDNLFGPWGSPSKDLSRPRLLGGTPKYEPRPQPARLFFFFFFPGSVPGRGLSAAVCHRSGLQPRRPFLHPLGEPDGVTNVP